MTIPGLYKMNSGVRDAAQTGHKRYPWFVVSRSTHNIGVNSSLARLAPIGSHTPCAVFNLWELCHERPA